MRPFLPPYHYNCRTRVILIEPADPTTPPGQLHNPNLQENTCRR